MLQNLNKQGRLEKCSASPSSDGDGAFSEMTNHSDQTAELQKTNLFQITEALNHRGFSAAAGGADIPNADHTANTLHSHVFTRKLLENDTNPR